ncbi:MAG: glycosyltransferase family 2 protein [Candidatus Falkowbacteria bacterium]
MISAIIPTYNRQAKLKETLASCEKQTLAKEDFEVIVVDDGSNDGTGNFMHEFMKTGKINLIYLYIAHHGPERARNFGVEKANGDIILFCDDDTSLDKDLLKIHEAHHKQNSGSALLGLALWDESGAVSDFMRYLAPAGPQFHYHTIKNKINAGFVHFYTCNISLAKKWLELEKFDERLNYAFEDIDLGLRLEGRGLKIVFNPEAKVYHSHYYNEEKFGQRMERVGRSAVIFFDKYRNNKKILSRLKRRYAPFTYFPGIKIFNRLSAFLATAKLIKKINIKYYWFWHICYYYSLGMLKELKQKNGIK